MTLGSSSRTEVFNIIFKNKLGVAAGLDKNGDYIDSLACLGFGFLEIGTVTPRPQAGNRKPRLFRLTSKKALINSMGFNNKGVDHLVRRMKIRKSVIPIGISIGKNFDTPNEKAHEDYLFCLKKTYEYASYIAVNISSPNTKNLRELQLGKSLDILLSTLKKEQNRLSKFHGYKPIFIKISPDNNTDELLKIFESIIDNKIDGLICSNTTSEHNYKNGKGGLSGAPLFNKSTEILKLARDSLGKEFPIIASGGVMNKDNYEEKLNAGASLVQIYTGFIYEGPALIKHILK